MKKSGFKIVEQRDFKGWLFTNFAIVTGFYSQAFSKGTIGSVTTSNLEGKKAIFTIRELLKVVEARGCIIYFDSVLL